MIVQQYSHYHPYIIIYLAARLSSETPFCGSVAGLSSQPCLCTHSGHCHHYILQKAFVGCFEVKIMYYCYCYIYNSCYMLCIIISFIFSYPFRYNTVTKLVVTMTQNMILSILLRTVLLLQGILVSSVAPDDQQSQCFNQVNGYTKTQKPLLDSYWYIRLLGTGAVWESIRGNSGNTGVSVSKIISCSYNLSSPLSLSKYSSSGLEG